MASAVSPRSKLNIRCALGIMVGRPPGKSCGLSDAKPYACETSLSRDEDAEKGHKGALRRSPERDDFSSNRHLALHGRRRALLGGVQRDVIRLKRPSGANRTRDHQ